MYIFEISSEVNLFSFFFYKYQHCFHHNWWSQVPESRYRKKVAETSKIIKLMMARQTSYI